MCPFCSSEVVEDTHHLFDVCPRWQPIRDKWSKNTHSHLPHCTLYTGVASLPSKAQAVLAAGIPPDSFTFSNCNPSSVDLALETYTASGHVAVYTDGCCLNQNSPLWRRAGYGLAYDVDLRHSCTVALPLLGLEQTAQRAELRAILHAISQDARPLHIFCDSSYVISVWESWRASVPLPFDGDNLDVISAIFQVLTDRSSPVIVSKVEAHSECQLNDAADAAAKQGARVHHTAAFLEARADFWKHRDAVVSRQRLMLEIVLERGRVAKSEKLLTFCKNDRHTSQNTTNDSSGSGGYLCHKPDAQIKCLKLGALKSFSRSLRFCFGKRLYEAMTWYLAEISWPDVPDNSTRGITWLEFAIDFEISTGLLLPAAAKRRTNAKGQRWRRGACEGATFAINPPETLECQHILIKLEGSPPKFQCTICLRSGNWGERSRFLEFTCADKPETTAQAVSRHRLAASKKKMLQNSSSAPSIPPLGDRAQSFADAFRMCLNRSNADTLDVLEGSQRACRSLSCFSLPLSAGLARRPLLLPQSLVTQELEHASHCHLHGLGYLLMPGILTGSLSTTLIDHNHCGGPVSLTESP